MLVIRDTSNDKLVHLIEIPSGRSFPNATVSHSEDIISIHLSQTDFTNSRLLAIMDRNQNLFLCIPFKSQLKLLAGNVESYIWNSECDVLAGILDGKLYVWYYPNIIFQDENAIEDVRSIIELR